jgi:TonB-dependent SusC/RagA subfamily outer membrane receptor
MHYVLISEKDWAESGEDIFTHEMAHIKNGHFFDLLLAEACVLLHWFNPAVWLLRQELQHVHEYEADESVIREGIDAKRYQLLLIKKAVGAQRFTSVANSFNHSTLKKRIAMMLKRKSQPWARLKYLYVLPLAVCAIAAFAHPEISHELEKISSVKLSEIVADTQVWPDTTLVQKNMTGIDTVMIGNIRMALGKVQPELEEAQAELEEVQAEDDPLVVYDAKAMNPLILLGKEMKEDPLILFDGKEITKEEMNRIPSEQIESISVFKDKAASDIYGEKGVNGVIVIKLKKEEKQEMDFKDKNPLILLDGKEITKEEMNKIPSEQIESVWVFKDKSVIAVYGEKAADGLVVIKLKEEYQ